MAETESPTAKSFAPQKQTLNPSRQPLQLYHLSHDLRGPLNSVLGFTELLLEGLEGPLNEVQIEDITAMRQSATALLNLISTVVDLSRLEADRLVLAFKPVDLELAVARVLELVAASAKTGQVKLVTDIPETMPRLWGDPDRTEQMILHVINFILKRKNGGQICLSAQPDQKMATIKIGVDEVITSPEEMEELFDLGVHVDSAGHSSLGKGGLTLPLAYGLAQKQQGKLWVESEEGVGTSFYLQLPLQQPS